MPWPPAAADFYLSNCASRPLFQGDIFRDVPFIKAQAGDTVLSEPRTRVERRHVATTLNPCDMYVDGRSVLGKVQAVALVRDASSDTIPEDWSGAFTLCPLPDLLGDGVLFVADFRAVGNVDRSYLTDDRRIRCLSELGWAIFRQRQAVAYSRSMISLDDLKGVGASTWREVMLWQQWQAAGRGVHDFHDWYDSADPNLGGLSRRIASERGMHDQVRISLFRELNAA